MEFIRENEPYYDVKVCPECGSDRILVKDGRWECGFRTNAIVKCMSCKKEVVGFKSAEEAVKFWNSLKSEFRPEPTSLEKFGPELRKAITTYIRDVLCHESESFIAAKVQTLEDFCRWAIGRNAEGAK